MNIHDYIPGSAYITLNREDFKSERKFEEYCSFMGKNPKASTIEIRVLPDAKKLDAEQISAWDKHQIIINTFKNYIEWMNENGFNTEEVYRVINGCCGLNIGEVEE